MKQPNRTAITSLAAPFSQRWKTNIQFMAAATRGPINEDSNELNCGEWLISSVKQLPLTAAGLHDARGLIIKRDHTPFEFSSDAPLVEFDCSHSQFVAVGFIATTFVGCCFDHSLFQYCDFKKCVFEKCSFTHSTFFEFAGSNHCRFIDCSFDGIVTQGQAYFLGQHSLWDRTSFREVHIKRWITDIQNVEFRSCSFSGCWEDAKFAGSRRLRKERWNGGLASLISHWSDSPAKFDRCDFTKLKLSNVAFEKGVEFTNCINQPDIQ